MADGVGDVADDVAWLVEHGIGGSTEAGRRTPAWDLATLESVRALLVSNAPSDLLEAFAAAREAGDDATNDAIDEDATQVMPSMLGPVGSPRRRASISAASGSGDLSPIADPGNPDHGDSGANMID